MISKNQSGFTEKELTNFKMGLYSTAIRGVDATGCFSVTKTGNVRMIKSASPSADFIRTPDYTAFEDDAYLNARIVVGHCRAATKGNAADEKNAHPFISENIALVHNGTLHTHKHLAVTTTDSEAIAVAFSKNDPKELIPNLHGAFALMWYDAKHKTFHASRNKDRPLWILQTPSVDFIGSEPGLLEWLHNRTLSTVEKAKYFVTDKIFNWKLKDLKDSFTETELKKTYPVTTHNTTTYTKDSHTSGKTAIYKGKPLQIHGTLCYNDRVVIQITKHVQIFSSSYVEGVNKKHPKTIFRCYLYQGLDNNPEIISAEQLEVTASGKQTAGKDQDVIIIATNPTVILKPEPKDTIILEDINGTIESLPEKDCFCSRCHVKIKLEDSKNVWFRIKKGLVKTIYCPVCVKSNNNLSVVK